MIEILVIVAVVIFTTIHFADFLASIFYHAGNPLARLLKLQDPQKSVKSKREYASATDIENQKLRVAHQGSSWNARSAEPDSDFKINEKVEIVGREGLTLIIKKMSSEYSCAASP